MNVAEIESGLKALSEKPFDPEGFPYSILEIYDAPRATLAKLKSGSMNKGERPGDVLWKGKLFFRPSSPGRTAATLDEMAASQAAAASRPRLILSSDGIEVSALDTRRQETLHGPWSQLNEQFEFLLPLSGAERFEAAKENPADERAAGRIAKFYDEILAANPDWREEARRHDLNIFMSRTLFCMFAEDTGILPDGLFARALETYSNQDGSNTREVLSAIFSAMDMKEGERQGVPAYAAAFPYVNGGLFRERRDVPEFNGRARRLLSEAAQLRWSQVNPDIFGSMIQAVVDPALRGDLGMHYTSVPNILKVIRPLFLDRLEKEFEAGKNSPQRLQRLLSRIYRLKVFDPACGSGNFLIVAYRELRRLEMRIFTRLQEISPQFTLPMSQVRISQFYGIEYADFAAETAKLSLWIAEHQANLEFRESFGSAPPALPLREGGRIAAGNALRTEWKAVCPPGGDGEVYIVGNPPYLGRAQQTEEQKADMAAVFEGRLKKYANMDYVTCWFAKGVDYIKGAAAEFAFVATNSVCQGDHVGLLWPGILKAGMEISFAHQSFKWKNSAAGNAGVTCVIVGIRNRNAEPKQLYSGNTVRTVANISPYLVEGSDVIVRSRADGLFGLTRMNFGSMSNDGGHLLFSPADMDKVLRVHPEAGKYFRRIYGSQEYIKGVERWCLWLKDHDLDEARAVPAVAERLAKVEAYRSGRSREATKEYADRPHLFIEDRHEEGVALFVPQISSEKRQYLPCGYLPEGSLVIAPHFVVFDPRPHELALLMCRLHTVWVAAVCGQLETRIRYSNTLGYNTFPVPALSRQQKEALEEGAWEVIAQREAHPDRTLAWLYDPKTMPSALLRAHQDLDATVETIYRGRPFRNDSERLEHLFRLYEAKAGKRASGSGGEAD